MKKSICVLFSLLGLVIFVLGCTEDGGGPAGEGSPGDSSVTDTSVTTGGGENFLPTDLLAFVLGNFDAPSVTGGSGSSSGSSSASKAREATRCQTLPALRSNSKTHTCPTRGFHPDCLSGTAHFEFSNGSGTMTICPNSGVTFNNAESDFTNTFSNLAWKNGFTCSGVASGHIKIHGNEINVTAKSGTIAADPSGCVKGYDISGKYNGWVAFELELKVTPGGTQSSEEVISGRICGQIDGKSGSCPILPGPLNTAKLGAPCLAP